MPSADDAKKLFNELRKQGKAALVINLGPYANDLDFPRDPPSCRVTVTARDPEQGNKVVDPVSADIPNTVVPYRHQFNIKVQTVAESIGKWFGFPTKRDLVVDVVAEPIGGWYEADESIKGIKVSAGSEESRNVSLKPRYEGSRLDRSKLLDKPRLEPPGGES